MRERAWLSLDRYNGPALFGRKVNPRVRAIVELCSDPLLLCDLDVVSMSRNVVEKNKGCRNVQRWKSAQLEPSNALTPLLPTETLLSRSEEINLTFLA